MTKDERGPRFQMFCTEKLNILFMPNENFGEFISFSDSDQPIDLSNSPLSAFTLNPNLTAGVLNAPSSDAYTLELYRDRGAQYPETERFSKYVYEIYEKFPPQFDFNEVVTYSDTNADAPLISFRDEHTFFVVQEKDDIENHHTSLPTSWRVILKSS